MQLQSKNRISGGRAIIQFTVVRKIPTTRTELWEAAVVEKVLC